MEIVVHGVPSGVAVHSTSLLRRETSICRETKPTHSSLQNQNVHRFALTWGIAVLSILVKREVLQSEQRVNWTNRSLKSHL